MFWRLSLAALLLFGASTLASSQPCPSPIPATTEDTLDPQLYYPLAVGNMWEYLHYAPPWHDIATSVEIVRDTVIHGFTLFKRVWTRYEYFPPEWVATETDVTYEGFLESRIVKWVPDLNLVRSVFDLAGAFNTCARDQWITGSYDAEVLVREADTARIVPLAASKCFGSENAATCYGHGVGITSSWGSRGESKELIRARVADREFGIPMKELFLGSMYLWPKTLYYPTQTATKLANPSDGHVVAFDSLTIRFRGGLRAYGIGVFLLEDTWYHRFTVEYDSRLVIGRELSPGISATILVSGLDPCIACGGKGAEFGPDTLLLYTDGSESPQLALIDLSRYVSAESDQIPRQAFVMELYPNPVGGRLVVSLQLAYPSSVEISTFDLLGRELETFQIPIVGAQQLELMTTSYPAGAYFVMARTEDGEVAIGKFIISR